MNDPERSMNATHVDPDEAIAVSALAAHPWPDFGPALQARLLMIPTLAGEPSSDAVAGPVPKVTDVTTRRGAPRDSRAWRREAWATAAVLATVAALALAAVGTARLRQARPVQEPSAVPPTPAATDAAIAPVEGMTNTSGLTGRLIYIKPAEGDGNATVFALDMRTGREERLWEAPGSDEGAAWAVSPDGRWLAYARGADFGRPRVIQVRSLDPDVAGEGATGASKAGGGTIVVSPDDSAIPEGSGTYERVHSVVWSSDSSAAYYDTLRMQESFPGAMASFSGWELHELSVGDRATERNAEAATGTPPSTPTPAVDDRVVARLDAAAIAAPDGMQLASLVAVDAVNHRAAVADGPGESGQVKGIALFDTNTGLEVQRVPTGFVEGFRATANRGGTAVIYSDCSGCDDADGKPSGRMLTLATGATIDIWSGRDGHPQPTQLVWSPDERWLAWTTGYPDVNKLTEVRAPTSRTEDLPAALGDPIAFAPDGGRLLMSTGQVIDLGVPTTGQREGQPLPWSLPSWLSERAYVERVLAWLPDADRAARPPAASVADALDSHLFFRTFPADGEPIAIHRLDMQTGRSELAWEAPRSTSTDASTHTIPVLSPDRSRVAVYREGLLDAGTSDAPSTLYVSPLERAARPPSDVLTVDNIQDIAWADDGEAVYYARPILGEGQPVPADDPTLPPAEADLIPLAGWELHRLALTSSEPGGLLNLGSGNAELRSLTEEGEDRVVIRLDAAALRGAMTTFLVDIDEDARRVIVHVADPLNDRLNDTLVLDLDTGEVVDRLGPPEASSYTCLVSAAPGKLSCHGGSEPGDPEANFHRYGQLDLATHQLETLWSGPFARDQYPLFPSPDGRWLVGVYLPNPLRSAMALETDEPTTQEPELDVVDLSDTNPPQDHIITGLTGRPKGFFPNSSVLLTSDGKLVDLEAAVERHEPPLTLSWSLPEPLRGEYDAMLGWFADTEAPTQR